MQANYIAQARAFALAEGAHLRILLVAFDLIDKAIENRPRLAPEKAKVPNGNRPAAL